MRRLFIILYLLLLPALSLNACGDDDDSSTSSGPADDGDDDNDDAADDDSVDDDADDDVIDDEADDDDAAPVLSNAFFTPNPPELGDFDLGELCWYTNLVWEVCDPDNDLLPNGNIFIGPEPLFENPTWRDLDVLQGDLEAVGDCASPATVRLTTLLGLQSNPDLLPAGEYCYTLQATDNGAHFSNLLEDICFTHSP
ncbi:MAG TPA: hypothetical protein PKW95_10625 [bacterium]|nr:hypothetical protein [bacterium]